MGSETDQVETKRDRVRRLVFTPLAERGFRFPRAFDADDQRKAMDAMIDTVTYLSDDALRALEQSLRSKGDGSARCFWPSINYGMTTAWSTSTIFTLNASLPSILKG